MSVSLTFWTELHSQYLSSNSLCYFWYNDSAYMSKILLHSYPSPLALPWQSSLIVPDVVFAKLNPSAQIIAQLTKSSIQIIVLPQKKSVFYVQGKKSDKQAKQPVFNQFVHSYFTKKIYAHTPNSNSVMYANQKCFSLRYLSYYISF